MCVSHPVGVMGRQESCVCLTLFKRGFTYCSVCGCLDRGDVRVMERPICGPDPMSEALCRAQCAMF